MMKRPDARLVKSLSGGRLAQGLPPSLALALQAAVWVFIPTLALAAEGGAPSSCLGSTDPWIVLACKGGNFLVLVGLLFLFARKPLARLFRGAAERTRSEVESVRDAARSAEEELAAQKAKIANLQAELERMSEAARAEARAESERILAEARAQAERIKAQMKVQVEQEFNKARAELRRQIAGDTIQLAEKRIRQQLDGKGRERLADAAIDRMEGRA